MAPECPTSRRDRGLYHLAITVVARVLASKLNLTRLMRDSQLLLCHVLCAVALMLRSLTAITDSVAVLAILAILRAVATLR